MREIERIEMDRIIKEKEKRGEPILFWGSGRGAILPEMMAIPHLRHAIKYCERNGIKRAIVQAMKAELGRKNGRA